MLTIGSFSSCSSRSITTLIFLLQDLIADSQVKFFLPFEDFGKSALPQNVDAYRRYMANSMSFTRARARRMQLWSEGLPN